MKEYKDIQKPNPQKKETSLKKEAPAIQNSSYRIVRKSL